MKRAYADKLVIWDYLLLQDIDLGYSEHYKCHIILNMKMVAFWTFITASFYMGLLLLGSMR